MAAAGDNANLTALHARNFLDCVSTRRSPTPTSRSATARPPSACWPTSRSASRQRLEWDAEKERFTNSEEANELLHYEYRKPWKLA